MATGCKSLFEARGRQNAMEVGKLPFIGMFFSSPPFIQVYSLQKVPRQDVGSVGLGAPGAGWWHRNTPSPILPASCMTCIGIHRGAGENPFRSWMPLNSMHFASSPALTQAWGGERRFLLRVNAVVCLPARTLLTLSSPFPQPNLRLSQETATV